MRLILARLPMVLKAGEQNRRLGHGHTILKMPSKAEYESNTTNAEEFDLIMLV